MSVLFSRSRSVILYDLTNSLLLTDRILADLRSNNGSLSESDPSEPKKTRAAFQYSKKAFKALDNLYRQRLIELQESRLR